MHALKKFRKVLGSDFSAANDSWDKTRERDNVPPVRLAREGSRRTVEDGDAI